MGILATGACGSPASCIQHSGPDIAVGSERVSAPFAGDGRVVIGWIARVDSDRGAAFGTGEGDLG